VVKATVFRHHVSSEQEFGSLEAAMRSSYVACEMNTAYVETITDGDKVYDREAMYAYWEEKGWD
jgi:hypothetical protein